ncbi:WD repeat-containing protein 76 [Nephila pilipes]|uniref:WD repeat-containing protein 76 n=1 Tax=Nephila pilipes TaxID=299642 RepID=A0A8X6TWF9_NEPPI|nr:WD repeat-containing protein 76 [Nephila pilipes]
MQEDGWSAVQTTTLFRKQDRLKNELGEMNRIPLCDITTSKLLLTPLDLAIHNQCVPKDKFEKIDFISEIKKDTETNFNKIKMKRKNLSEEVEIDVKKIKDEDTEIGELSEYEKMIQKNREEQMAFLESLKMNEVKEEFKEAVRRLKPSKPKKVKSPKAVQMPQVPTRKSLRLAKIDIDLSEAAIEARALAESEKELMKELPPVLSFEEAITGENVYDDFVHDFDNMDFKIAEPFYNYTSHFKTMKIDETKIAKVVNGRITAMAIHPVKEKIIVCVGNKYGAVGLWDVNSDSVPYEFIPHLQGVTNLKYNPDLPNVFYSSSYDGILRCGDIECKNFTEIYNISDESSCTYFDFLSSTTFIVSQRDGNVSVVDNRSDCKTWEKRHKCHEYSVKSVSVHPVNKSYFVSADVKGLISLWDLRKLQNKPVIEVHHHKRVVSSAFFSPVTGNSILTTSSDDSICLFDTSKLGNAMTLQKSLKHNNYTGRWLTPFKATWLPNTDDTFVVGSMLNPRRIQIFDSQMKNIFDFQDEYLSSVACVNAFHPSLPVLAGCNASGKVYIFAE